MKRCNCVRGGGNPSNWCRTAILADVASMIASRVLWYCRDLERANGEKAVSEHATSRSRRRDGRDTDTRYYGVDRCQSYFGGSRSRWAVTIFKVLQRHFSPHQTWHSSLVSLFRDNSCNLYLLGTPACLRR